MGYYLQPIGAAASGGITTRTFSSRFGQLLYPADFGAAGNGSTDNSTALQDWLNAGAAGSALGLPAATFAFGTPLSLLNPTGLTIIGAGSYQSVFKYTGASTTTDLITIGSTSGPGSTNVCMQGFRIMSATLMTGGATLHVENTAEGVFRDIVTDGIGGNGNLWHGAWFDEVADIKFFGGTLYGQGDQLRVNGSISGYKAEFLTVGTRIRGIGSSSVGIHIAGAFGGFSATGYTSIDMANINLLIDTAVVNEGNREIFINPDCIVDTATTDNIQVNDTGPGTGGGGTLNLMGWNSGAGRYGINIINWADGWVTMTNGPVIHAGSDNIRLSDPTANYIIGTQRITGSGGWGVNATVPIAQVYAQPGGVLTSNASGNWAPNTSPKTTLPGATTIDGSVSIAESPTIAWGLDFTNCAITISNGASATLPAGSGLIVVSDLNNGDTGVYLVNDGGSVLISSIQGKWVAATTTPAAGKKSIAYNGSAYTIYNNSGSSSTIGVALIRTSSSN